MTQNKYTGDVATYAKMQALTDAMRLTMLNLRKPDKLTLDFIDMLQRLTVDRAPSEIRRRIDNPMFRTWMQKYVNDCGLSTVSILSALKRFENV